MKVKIPKSILEVDDYTSVICRLSYPNGLKNGKKSSTDDFILVKQKKDEPSESEPKRLTPTQIIIISVSVSVFFGLSGMTILAIVFVCILKKRKRSQYKVINDTQKY